MLCSFFFFFQAEDGIRYGRVTGVQTCALPIWCGWAISRSSARRDPVDRVRAEEREMAHPHPPPVPLLDQRGRRQQVVEIGRASCRERGEISGGGGALKKKKERTQGNATPRDNR